MATKSSVLGGGHEAGELLDARDGHAVAGHALLHAGESLVLRRDHVPRSEAVVRAGEHLGRRPVVLAVLLPVAPVLLGQLPSPERVRLAGAEPLELLLV